MKQQPRPATRVLVKLQDVGDVELVVAGPLTIKLVRMLQNNGQRYVEEWMNKHGLYGVAEDAYYDETLHQVVKITIHPLSDLLLGVSSDSKKIYRLIEHHILEIKLPKRHK